MKKLVCIICVISALFLIDATKTQKDQVIIYSSMEQYRGEELQKQLDRAFPDENILVMYVSTAKAAAKIKVEKTNSDADIVVGLESSYLSLVQNSLADLSHIEEEPYLEDLKMSHQSNKFVTWERQAGTFIINDQVMKKHHLPPFKTYQDLCNPIYKGFIAMPDPKTSGTGYLFYKSVMNSLGDTEGLKYFAALEKNLKTFTESGSGPVKLLKQGEIAIGLGLTFQAMDEIHKGSPFRIQYPLEGSPYSLTGTAMIKGKKNPRTNKIFDFIIHDFFQYDKAFFSPEQVLIKQENKIEGYPPNIPYANMEGITQMKEKERLLNLWKY